MDQPRRLDVRRHAKCELGPGPRNPGLGCFPRHLPKLEHGASARTTLWLSRWAVEWTDCASRTLRPQTVTEAYTLDGKAVTVTATVTGTAPLAQLAFTVPVFLTDGQRNTTWTILTDTTIHCQSGTGACADVPMRAHLRSCGRVGRVVSLGGDATSGLGTTCAVFEILPSARQSVVSAVRLGACAAPSAEPFP